MSDKTSQTANPGAGRLDKALSCARPMLRRGSLLSAAAALLWIPQAFVIAAFLSALLTDPNSASPGLSALMFLCLACGRAVLTGWSERLLYRAAETVLAQERAAMLAHECKSSGVSRIGGAGAVSALATDKLAALVHYITRFSAARARVMAVPMIILAIAFWQSWAVGIVLMVAGPLIPVFMALVGWAAKEASEKQMVEIGQLGDVLVDRLSAMPDVRILSAGRQVVGQFEEVAERLRQRTMAVLRVAFLSSTVLELFAALGVAMVAVWVGFALLGVIGWGSWGVPLTPFVGIFLLLLAPDYFQPLRDLSAAWHDKAAALAVANELDQYDADEDELMLGDGRDCPALGGAATIKTQGLKMLRGGSTITYPDIEISPAEKIAVTGASGAGKTTLLRLIAGIERADAGILHVAGHALDDDTADAWRARLGWMPQAPRFLDASLRENIAFGAPVPDDLIKQAVLKEVIETLPDGLDTVLGETGGGLSGGEARRVMLARAIIAAPDVLQADEPTADLDSATAGQVIDGLLALAESGVTLIVATHDPRLVARMDRVISLEDQS